MGILSVIGLIIFILLVMPSFTMFIQFAVTMTALMSIWAAWLYFFPLVEFRVDENDNEYDKHITTSGLVYLGFFLYMFVATGFLWSIGVIK